MIKYTIVRTTITAESTIVTAETQEEALSIVNKEQNLCVWNKINVDSESNIYIVNSELKYLE